MYDELISSLRICGRINSENDNCIAFHDGSCEAEPVCMYELMCKAADAIEFLQTYKVAFENIISMGGWWLVGQDKNLYRMNVPMSWPPKGTKTVEVFPLPEPPKEET
jgi:hypothetical protein